MAFQYSRLVRRKSVAVMVAESGANTGGGELNRTIGVFQLAMIGIGATIGTGIFFVLSQAVPLAGPAVVWSFVIAGVVAGLTAVCYAELASAVPVSGSAYSYAYATLGEGVAMIVAACLLLEYGVSASAVAVGWSQYLNQLLDNVFGVRIPQALAAAPEAGGWVNVPAMVLVALCALLLIRGTAESARANAVMVLVKLGVLALFVVIGVRGWNTDHLANFAPYGVTGVYGAAGVIFFSFVGLDNVATAGEEVRNPRRTMPLAIMIALATVTVVYVAVALVAVGAQRREKFEGQEAGLAAILQDIVGSSWPGTVLAAGAIISIFSVTLTALYAQTRILFAMSRDGLVPPVFRRINPRTTTPVRNTVIVSTAAAILAGLIPIEFLSEMTSIGTLVAFMVVSVGVIVLRRTAPDLPRGFRVPGYPVTPILSILGCLLIIVSLRPITIVASVIWTGAALVWYFAWGIRHSALEPPR
ncbi:amino acid permease [Pseudonocardia spinosispora]|uniref:amino acid permease n=1 Tax=Pseudonocardia spinosispora TaxID=103441 RepID=UPI000403BDE1|nr:amino acid permease [Pseudonocardia spinosispora]